MLWIIVDIIAILAILFGAYATWCQRKRLKSRKAKRAATIGLAGAVLLFTLVICQRYLSIKSDRAQNEKNWQQDCRIDSLRSLIDVPDNFEENRSQAKLLAQCLEKKVQNKLDSALVAIGLGKFDVAVSLLDSALSVAKGDSTKIAVIYNYLGYAYTYAGDTTNALANCDSAIAYKPDFSKAWYNRGSLLVRLGKFADAIVNFDRAISYEHGDVDAWLNRGSALIGLGRHNDALDDFDSALVYNHENANVWYSRGVVLGKMGQHADALASYDSALIYRYDYADAWSYRGNELGELGRNGDALTSYDSALVCEHDDMIAWLNRGIALEELGRHADALASCDSALRYDPNLVEAKTLRTYIEQQLSAQKK